MCVMFQVKIMLILGSSFLLKLVYFFQTRSICFNLVGQFGAGKTKVTGNKSQVIACQYRKYPKHSLKLTLGLIRPEQKLYSIGLMSAPVNS